MPTPAKEQCTSRHPPHPTSHPNQVVRNKNGLHCGKTDQERLLRHFRHVAQPPTPLTAACHRWGCDHLHPCPSMSNGTSTIVRLVDCRMTAETILASAANSFAIPAASLAIIFCWPVTFVNKGLRLRSPLPSTNREGQTI